MKSRKAIGAPWLALWLALAGAGASAPAADAPKDSDCLLCHEDQTLAKTNANGQVKSLYVDLAKLRGSAHQTNTCASCHVDVTDQHPDDNVALKPANCAGCHGRMVESYAASVHGLALEAGDPAAPTCRDCHDGHEVVPPHPPQFAFAFLEPHQDLRDLP